MSSRSRPPAAALALALCLAGAARAQQVAPEELVLDNGMKFLLLPRKDQPGSITAGWVAKVGSVDERPGITGIAHFFEHMMFKGTRTIGTRDPAQDAKLSAEQHRLRGELRRLHLGQQYRRWRLGEIPDPWDPKHDTDDMKALRAELAKVVEAQRAIIVKDEFDQIYTKLGGTRMNAFTSHDLTFYFITVPGNKLELWAWMESDRLHDSVFREFYSERDVVHEERRMRTESTPTGVFSEQFDAMFWASSPYAWPVIGWPTDLNSYTFEQAQGFFRTYYRPNNLVGVIVGDFDLAQARALVPRYFGRLERGEDPPTVVTLEVEQRAPIRMEAEVEAAPEVEVRYHSVPFDHPDEFALEILAELLNGRTGRLYRALVEGKELATQAGVRQDSRKYGGAFSFSAECKGDVDPAAVERAWFEEVVRLVEEPVAARELEKVKNRVLADSFRRLEDNYFLMLQLGYYEALGGWRYINEAPGKLAAVTAEDIQRVARTYLKETNRATALFRRKAGAAQSPADAALEKLPANLRPMAKQAMGQLAQMTDPAQVQAELAQLEAQRAQVPPDYHPLIDFVLERMRERLAALQEGK